MNSDSTHHATGPVRGSAHLLPTTPDATISVRIGDDSGGFTLFTSDPDNCAKIAAAFTEAERMLREAAAAKMAPPKPVDVPRAELERQAELRRREEALLPDREKLAVWAEDIRQLRESPPEVSSSEAELLIARVQGALSAISEELWGFGK